jgi:DNA-binding CsgD family transcriptional regulator
MAHALQQIANSVGAEGATLTYSHGSIQLGAVTSEALLEHVAPYLSSDRPADPRPARVNPTLAEGFRLDQDDFSAEELASDPYYQEFLRDRGFGWHACALLAGAPEGDAVNLSLRRTLRQGMFDQAELSALSAHLPLIRSMAHIAQMAGGFAGSLAQADLDERCCLFGLDAKGGAFVVHRGARASGVLRVRAGALVVIDPAQRARVKAAIERAHAEARETSVILIDPDDEWQALTIVPASMTSPSGLTPFLSWAMLAPCIRTEGVDSAQARRMAVLFGLSVAEARVAALIGQAKSVETTARVLATSPGTVRNHLKAIFAKIGVGRQAELVAIFSRF